MHLAKLPCRLPWRRPLPAPPSDPTYRLSPYRLPAHTAYPSAPAPPLHACLRRNAGIQGCAIVTEALRSGSKAIIASPLPLLADSAKGYYWGVMYVVCDCHEVLLLCCPVLDESHEQHSLRSDQQSSKQPNSPSFGTVTASLRKIIQVLHIQQALPLFCAARSSILLVSSSAKAGDR